ncbi:MAG: hypothetical protein ABSB89_09300 [Candidatus Bathyarchaeia archaeon]
MIDVSIHEETKPDERGIARVQKNFRDLNVSLPDLVKEIIEFFESEKFDNVTALKTETGYEIIAGDSHNYKMETDVQVTIEGTPDDFTLALTQCKEEKTHTTAPMMLAQMFGLGYLYLKSVRSQEAIQKLETNFRKKLGGMISQTQQDREIRNP